MPTIPYIIQKSVQRLVNGRKRWFTHYETVFIDVSEEVAVFLAKDSKREQNYQARMKKLKRIAKIHKTFSLDEIIHSNDGAESLVGELIADTIHKDNFNPLEIVMEKEREYERRHGIKSEDEESNTLAGFIKKCALIMTKKQFKAWIYSKAGLSNIEIASILKIDESSVRERVKNAEKRIEKINSRKFL